MLYVIIGLFGLAALFGIILLVNFSKKQSLSTQTAVIHGSIAALGLFLMLYYAYTHETIFPKYSLLAFILAASGGVLLASRHMKGKAGPLWLILLHGLVAAGGLILLLLFVL